MAITSDDISLLKGLTRTKPICVKIEEGKALLHAKWFTLELPVGLLKIDSETWSDEPLNGALEWRSLMPPGEGEYAQATRFTSESGDALIKLLSDSHTGVMHTSLYEVVMKHVNEPEFRLFPGEHSFLGIYSAGALVGAAAQVKP